MIYDRCNATPTIGDTMQIISLDHLVLTVKNIDASVYFYTTVLGMELVTFGRGRIALSFGSQKINLHQRGSEFSPHAQHPTPGASDLCFITTTPMPEVIAHLDAYKVTIFEGPLQRTGATGAIMSVYCHDPDMNLIEISNKI